MANKNPLRIITTKEAKQVLGKSIRTARRLMNDVRIYFEKEPRQPVTAQEFCHYFNYNFDDLHNFLGWDKR
jgi:hypothetical protein